MLFHHTSEITVWKHGGHSLTFRMMLNHSYGANTTDIPMLGDKCEELNGNSSKLDVEGTLEWSRSFQGAVLSAYFYGYIVTQVPAGWLANRIGPRLVLVIGLGVSALSTLFIPLAARTSVYFVIALRVICGLGSAVTFPAFHMLWSRWAPTYERTKLVTICYGGTTTGNIVTYFMSGYLCAYGFDGGWPSIFYLTGTFEILWLILCMVLIHDSPTDHPYISEDEKEYITTDVGITKIAKDHKLPWMKFLKSPPFMALLVTHVCNNYSEYTLVICLPIYMRDVLKFDMEQNGVFSSLPYITQLVCTILFGWVADTLRERGVRTVVVRKVYQFLGSIMPGAFLVAASFVSCEARMTAVGFLIASVGFISFTGSGYVVNHIDIAPRYAGVLFALTNSFATVPGMVAPLVVGLLTTNGTREEWQVVFYICGAVYIFGTIAFLAFAQGEVQPWARDHKTEINTQERYRQQIKYKENSLYSVDEHDSDSEEEL